MFTMRVLGQINKQKTISIGFWINAYKVKLAINKVITSVEFYEGSRNTDFD